MDYHLLAEELIELHRRLLSFPVNRMLADLAKGELFVLNYLIVHQDPVHPKELSQQMMVSTARVAPLLNRMEEKGLIRRCNEDGNRRSLHVYLTEQGWDKQREVRQTMERQSEAVQAGLSEEQRAQLLDCLYKVCANMTDMEGLQ